MIKSSRTTAQSWISVMLSMLLVLMPVTPVFAEATNGSPAGDIRFGAVRVLPNPAAPESALYLRPTDDDHWWSLEQRVAGKLTSPSGSFRIDKTFDVPTKHDRALSPILEQKGVRKFERTMVTGTLYGIDGEMRQVGGILLDIVVVEEGAETAERVFVPMIESSDPVALERLSAKIGETLRAQDRFTDSTPGKALTSRADTFAMLEKSSTCEKSCHDDFDEDRAICKLGFTACVGLSSAVTIGCLVACPASGPLVIPCIIACGVIDVSGALLCLVDFYLCQSQAEDDYHNCERECLHEGYD